MKIFFIYISLCLIWGSTWLVIRIGLEDLTPLFSAAIRFAVAAAFILILMRLRQIKLQTDKISVRLYILIGTLSLALPFFFIYWAEQFVPSGLAAVLFAVYPFFIALFSYLYISKDQIDIYKAAGMVLAFGGILIIFSDEFGKDLSLYLIGMSAIVIAAVIQASMAVTIKKFGNHLNPLSINLVPMTIAAAVLFLAAFLFEDFSKQTFTGSAAASILYLAFFGSVVTFTGYYYLLKRINIVILSLITFVTPIIALLLGWIFYNEQLSNKDFWGSMLVLTGLLAANMKGLIMLRKRKILHQE
jgi:drug/metabolite transporter (DMT)-like permease